MENIKTYRLSNDSKNVRRRFLKIAFVFWLKNEIMEDRKTFVFYTNWYEAFKDFEPKVQLEIFNAIILYATKNIEIDLSPIAKMAFNFIKKDIDSNAGKYDAICVRNQTNGKKGGRPKKNREKPKKPSGFLDNPNNPFGFSDNPKKPNGFSEKETENEKEKQEKERTKEKEIKEKDKEKDLLPPIIPQMGEVSEKKILKLDLSNPNEEKEKSCAKKEKEVRHFYGTYKNVLLSDSEYEKLMEYDNASAIIDFFSEMKEMKGYNYKRDYLAIKNWGIRAYDERNNKNTKATTRACSDAENKRRELANLNEIALAILSSPPA